MLRLVGQYYKSRMSHSIEDVNASVIHISHVNTNHPIVIISRIFADISQLIHFAAIAFTLRTV